LRKEIRRLRGRIDELESGMSEDTGVWAYAITEDGHLAGPDGEVDLSWLTGVGETKVRTTASCGLTVLVSDVSLAEYGEAALRENLKHLDWLDEVAREHHYVIDAAARLFPLLPVRLATVYSGDAAVRAALTSRCGQLRDALRRVGGRVEWGVKAYAAAPGDDGAGETGGDAADAERAPAIVSAGDGDDQEPKTEGGAGMAYLRRRRAQLTSARESRSVAVSGAQAVHADRHPAAPAAVRTAQRRPSAGAAERRLPARNGRLRYLHRGSRGPGERAPRAAGRADRTMAAVLVRRRRR
jgi:Gas vesicle synthesis protein GvpL/GvpF